MSKYRYNVKFEAAPIMSKDGEKTTLSETVFCDEINVKCRNYEPILVEFIDDEAVALSVHYDKFVSAERVSNNNE